MPLRGKPPSYYSGSSKVIGHTDYSLVTGEPLNKTHSNRYRLDSSPTQLCLVIHAEQEEEELEGGPFSKLWR